jgi:hypothetical protein
MYANGRADYRRPLEPVGADVGPVSFELNRLKRSETNSVEKVAATLQDWMRRIEGDSFIFEYYGGAETIERARVVWQDARNLRRFGLNGLVNCQPLRVFFPTGLGMVVLGRSLWDTTLDFDEMAADYFRAAYGPDGTACRGFLAETERLSGEINRLFEGEEDAAAAIEELRCAMDGCRPVLERNESAAQDRCRATSWRLMGLYVHIMREFVAYAEARASGHPTALGMIGHPLREYLYSIEDEYQPFLRPKRFLRRLLG